MSQDKSEKDLLKEVEQLRARLAEQEETLCAIRSGEVDAVVVSGADGEQVYTLRGADTPYRSLIEQMDDGAATLTADGTIIFCNQSFAKMLKISLQEALGTNIMKYIAQKGKLMFEKQLYNAVAKSVKTEAYFTVKDGPTLPAELSLSPLQMDKSQAITLIARDITERKVAEQKTREQASLLDTAKDAIFVQDLDGRTIYWNPGAERLYGWTTEEILGRNINLLTTKKSVLADAERSTRERGGWIGEMRQATKDGKEVTVESHRTLVRDENGRPKSILTINYDITERKMLEAHLRRVQRLESIGVLAGGIAHDLNNILTPIIMSLRMLDEKIMDEENKKLVEVSYRSAQRGAGLVKQIQAFQHDTASDRKLVNIESIVSDISYLMKETFPKNIELQVDVSKDGSSVLGDATQLHQVIMNLCVNARDAMPNGGTLTITAKNTAISERYARMNPEAKPSAYVVITISDTGTGIPDHVRDKMFEPFFTTKPFGKGTGLGLSIAHGLVKSHDGFIEVESEVGKGSEFKIYLPAIKTSSRPILKKETTKASRGQGETILLIEDEPLVAQVTESILKKYGYNVVTANDGAEALSIYAQHNEVDVAIVDQMMPNMDGRSAINELHKINPNLKIIVVSGLVENAKYVDGTDIQAFLQKPYTIDRLLKTIRVILNSNNAQWQ